MREATKNPMPSRLDVPTTRPVHHGPCPNLSSYGGPVVVPSDALVGDTVDNMGRRRVIEYIFPDRHGPRAATLLALTAPVPVVA